MGEDVIYNNGCIVVGNDLVGFLKGYTNYEIPYFVNKIGSELLAKDYKETFGDDFVDPTFDISMLYGSKINVPYKDYMEIENIQLLSFPLEW